VKGTEGRVSFGEDRRVLTRPTTTTDEGKFFGGCVRKGTFEKKGRKELSD